MWRHVFHFLTVDHVSGTLAFVSRSFAYIAHARLHEFCAQLRANNTRHLYFTITALNASRLPTSRPPDNVLSIRSVHIEYDIFPLSYLPIAFIYGSTYLGILMTMCFLFLHVPAH